MRTKQLRRITLLTLLFAASQSFAGGVGTIGGPTILPFVKHKILVLEFDTPERATWGKEISQMLSQEILGTIRGVTGAGVVNLRQPEQRVTLTADTVVGIALQNKGLVAIWGEFYQEQGSVFLHTHLRIVPQEGFAESGLGLTLNSPWGRISASPPTLQVNFAPIEVSLQTLESLKLYFEQTVTLHEKPMASSRKVGSLKPGDTYYPIDVRAEWIKIKMTGNKTGWIRYATLSSQKELSPLRAVMIYAQGVLQYIGGNFTAAVQSMESYITQYGASQDAMNRALAHILLGNARRWALGGPKVPPNESVFKEYQAASELLPNNSSPVCYLAIARLSAIANDPVHADRGSMREVEKKLIHVIQVENDLQAVQNLKLFYGLARETEFLAEPGSNLTRYRDELNQRVAQLSEIEDKLRR